MIGFVLAVAIAGRADSSLPVATSPHGPPSRADALAAVASCGLPASQVTVRFEPDLQEDVVRVARGKAPFTGRRLECVARASLRTYYYVQFDEAAIQKRYDPIYDRLEYTAETARARNWLAQRNLLAKLPLPERGKPLSNYAEAVETFCGIPKGTLLVARDAHSLTYAEGALGQITSRGIEHAAANEAQSECVMAATSAADLRSRGVFFGFIARLAVPER